MDVVDVVPASLPTETQMSKPAVWDRSEGLTNWVFGAFVAIAAVALLLHFGRYHWFHGDEWDFLVDRDAGNLGDLLRAHNEHLSFLPILAYRFMWGLFGLRSYVPYQVPVIALHLTAAVLLRAVMRRCGVHPWIATAAAGVFVLFGPGEENIVWAFQIGFTGSLAFGLGHLLLADHPGGIDRRDWLGLGVGFLGLLCSGLTPLTAGVVGAVVLVRRGWKPAAFNVVPLAVVYLTWSLTIGPNVVHSPYSDRAPDVGDIAHFVQRSLVATFEGIAGGSAVLAAAFAILLVVGLAVAYVPLRGRARLEAAVMPVSLLAAGPAFAVTSAYGRWWFGDVGASSRYVHLIAAFSLPALAVAADALARHWRFGVPVATLVFVALIPYVASQFDTNDPWNDNYFRARRELIAALGRSEYIDQVPRATRPDPVWSTVTAGWLLDARKAGDLPPLEDPSRVDDPFMRLRFGLSVIDAPVPSDYCEPLSKPTDVVLNKGDELGINVSPHASIPVGHTPSYYVRLLEQGKPVEGRLGIHPAVGRLLRAELDDLHVRFVPSPGAALQLCR
jgi:hypothetical protein